MLHIACVLLLGNVLCLLSANSGIKAAETNASSNNTAEELFGQIFNTTNKEVQGLGVFFNQSLHDISKLLQNILRGLTDGWQLVLIKFGPNFEKNFN